MKLKRILGMLLVLLIVIGLAPKAIADEAVGQETVKNPDVVYLDLDTPTKTDQSGCVSLPGQALLDLAFPAEINGQPVKRISAGAFKGCPYFASVTIPACVEEIGTEAFADSPQLNYIVLEGRANTQGMTLGENWSGTATVIFGDLIRDKSTPDETFKIKSSAGPGGSISPAGEVTLTQGTTRTYSITPKAGYAIQDVVVDGKSIGVKATYTFPNISQNHTISATFRSKMSLDVGDGTLIGPKNGILKSGYGFGIRIPFTAENAIVTASAQMSNGDTCGVTQSGGNLVFVKNTKSPTKANVYYVPASTKDGPFTCTVTVTAKNMNDPNDVITQTIRKTVNIQGSMYEDDFTGDRK